MPLWNNEPQHTDLLAAASPTHYRIHYATRSSRSFCHRSWAHRSICSSRALSTGGMSRAKTGTSDGSCQTVFELVHRSGSTNVWSSRTDRAGSALMRSRHWCRRPVTTSCSYADEWRGSWSSAGDWLRVTQSSLRQMLNSVRRDMVQWARDKSRAARWCCRSLACFQGWIPSSWAATISCREINLQ